MSEQTENLQILIRRIHDVYGSTSEIRDLLLRAQALQTEANSGVDIGEQMRVLYDEMKSRERAMRIGLRAKEAALKAKYPVGQRVKFLDSSTSREWYTGTVCKFLEPGRSRSMRIWRVQIDCDHGDKIDLALAYAESTHQMQAIDNSHSPFVSPTIAAARESQRDFNKGDWVEIDFGWRKVSAEVVGFYKDGALRLHHDGSNHKHPPAGLKKIPRPANP